MPHPASAAAARATPAAAATASSSSDATSFDAAAAAAAAANKTRRSHRKSRNGCAECKRRHIRCDEHRPLCSNCVSADRTCVFPRGPTPSTGVSKPTPGPATTTTTNGSHRRHHQPSPGVGTTPPSPRRGDFSFEALCGGPLPPPSPSLAAAATPVHHRTSYTYFPSPAAGAAGAVDGGGGSGSAPPTPTTTSALDADASVFTPFHLQIMHHIQTVMLPDPDINTGNHFQQIMDIAVRHAVDAPYLINEMLALSAVHMATQKEMQLLQLQQHQQQQNQHPQQQQQQPQNHNDSGSGSSTCNTPAPTSSLHAPTVLPPLLPPHGSPSSTSSPASSSTTAAGTPLPSLAAATAAAAHPAVASLRHQATELQTRAVANFTRLTAHLPPDDTASCIPRFLFSSTLSMHALADSLAELRAPRADFHGFVDRFVGCFNLYRGIRAVIYPTWRFLSDSELRPLLTVTREANLGIVERGCECAPLQALLARSDLAPASLDACRAAVEKLQWAFDLHNNLAPHSGQHAVSAFSVIVGADYVDVLRKHRPEALIILSYFAVLLHRCRHFWIFQNSGACMIKAIANHIGSYWRDAMAWPLQVVETEDC